MMVILTSISIVTSVNSTQMITGWGFNETTGDAIAYEGFNLNQTGTVGNGSGIYEYSRGIYSGSDYFSYPTTSTIQFNDTSSFSISLWFNITSFDYAYSSIMTIAKSIGYVSLNDLIFDIHTDSNGASIFFTLSNVGAGGELAELDTTILVNEWHHVVAVYNNSALTIFLDGVQGSTVNYTYGSGNGYPATEVQVGTEVSGSTTRFVNGYIDELYIFDYPLTESDITYLQSNFYPFTNETNVTCIENWIQNNTLCDGFNYTIQYYDSNNCGTFDDLPVSNGTIVDCQPVPPISGNTVISNGINGISSMIVILIIISSLFAVALIFMPKEWITGKMLIFMVAIIGILLLMIGLTLLKIV